MYHKRAAGYRPGFARQLQLKIILTQSLALVRLLAITESVLVEGASTGVSVSPGQDVARGGLLTDAHNPAQPGTRLVELNLIKKKQNGTSVLVRVWFKIVLQFRKCVCVMTFVFLPVAFLLKVCDWQNIFFQIWQKMTVANIDGLILGERKQRSSKKWLKRTDYDGDTEQGVDRHASAVLSSVSSVQYVVLTMLLCQ